MRTVVTGDGTLDTKSSSVRGGCVVDNVDNSTSCEASGRVIEELNEDERSAGRYLSVVKWSNTAIDYRPNDAVGCKAARTHKTMYANAKRDVRSHEHGEVNASLPTRRNNTSLRTFQFRPPDSRGGWVHRSRRVMGRDGKLLLT